MSVKINAFQIENVKRVRAVELVPVQNGLTIIGGDNGQGKTSVLDGIAWCLGGEKYRPTQAQNSDSVLPPSLKITLSNGLIVERKGKNSSLTVTDPSGQKAGQTLLNSFVEQFALDLPKFMVSSDSDKAETLLKIIGVGDELRKLNQEENSFYQDRLYIGRERDQKQKYADELIFYPNMPEMPVSAHELIMRQQEILGKNAENQRLRRDKDLWEERLAQAKNDLLEAQRKVDEAEKNLEIASKSAENLVDESTAEIEEDIKRIDDINRKVRANLDKVAAQETAKNLFDKYNNLTEKIEDVRKQRKKLLDNAALPLEGLSVEDGALTYKSQKWDCMSGAEQLKVATAIVRALNPNCGFVLIDKLEQMDRKTLDEFGKWLEEQNLQAIATRVSSGDECSIIIEDGYVKQDSEPKVDTTSSGWDKWKGI